MAIYPHRGQGPADLWPRLFASAQRELLICRHAHGIPAGRSPVRRLRQAEDSDMTAAYLESFERLWALARSVD